jgi:hypothetical protein
MLDPYESNTPTRDNIHADLQSALYSIGVFREKQSLHSMAKVFDNCSPPFSESHKAGSHPHGNLLVLGEQRIT